jgi:phosphohistidine phosphatase SixA
MVSLFTRGTSITVVLLMLAGGAVSASLLINSKSVADNLGVGGALGEHPYVILLRHGEAPGRHEPLGFNLNDCSKQRNLSDKGREDSRQLGELLRARRINVTKVVTSRWCRARETAELLKLGPIEDDPAFDNMTFNELRAAELLDQEREHIASWRGPGVLVIVTHNSNIKALTGLDIEEGDILVSDPVGRNATSLFAYWSVTDIPTALANTRLIGR